MVKKTAGLPLNTLFAEVRNAAMVHADRNLLFGILAVQMNFVTRDALITGMNTWLLEKHVSLGQVLVDQGVLSPARLALLDPLVDEHLASHGDVEASLAAMNQATEGRSVATIRDALTSVDKTELPASLQRILAELPENNGSHRSADLTETLPVEAELGERASARYRVLRPHAKGGIGQVVVALDLELNREVALKAILPEQADNADSRARFLLEAEVTGRLEHPGVVPLYSLGADASGRPFYAMRFVKGESLKEAIAGFHSSSGNEDKGLQSDQWNRSLRRLLNRFVDVCNVVGYAHSRGVIHRDLKPANILLGPYGETLVVDWGLAKLVGRRDPVATQGPVEATLRAGTASSTTETVAGTAIGTPAYMSPEQAEGRLVEIGKASDIFSLGATLYSILVGRPPFEGPDILTVLRKVQRGDFPPPRQLNPRVPGCLEAICLKAMAHDPTKRYGTARALAEDVEHWMADDPVSVYREPLSTRITRWGRRHRTSAVGLGVLLVTTVAALAISTALIGREQAQTERQRLQALANLEEAKLQRDRAARNALEVTEQAQTLERQLYVNRVNLGQREYQENVAASELLLEQCPPTLRGWEWTYLKRLCHLDLRTLTGHKQAVHCVSVSPNGRVLVSGGGADYTGAKETEEAELIAWDPTTGRETRRFKGLKGKINSLAFNPDGTKLAVGSGFYLPGTEGRLTLLDFSSGAILWSRSEKLINVQSVAFSPDGKTVAAGYGNYSSGTPGWVMLWDSSTGARLAAESTATGGVNELAFSPDGKTLAAACSGVVELWQPTPLCKVRSLEGHTNWIYGLAFSPDGLHLATASWDKTIKIREIASGTVLFTLVGHNSFVNSVRFSPDGKQLASVGEDHSLKIWDAATGSLIRTYLGHQRGLTAVTYSSDGSILATASQDGTVKLWDAARDPQFQFTAHKGWINSVAFRPDGKQIATGSGDWTVALWDPATGSLARKLEGHKGWVFSVAYSPDGKVLASASEDESVRLWDVATGQELRRLGEKLGMYVRCVSFSPDGSLIAACTGGPDERDMGVNSVYVWRAATGEQLLRFQGQKGRIFSLCFSPDGRWIASGSSPTKDQAQPAAELLIWDATTGSIGHRLSGHTGVITSLLFSRDGRLLVSGGEDGMVRIWDPLSGSPILSIRGSDQGIFSLAMNPEGTRLAVGSLERNITLWDTKTAHKILALPGHTSGVVSLAFSPDGQRLASGSIDWTARIWEAISVPSP